MMIKIITKKDRQSTNKLFYIFIEESFYFLTALLFVGLIVELILPGLFQLYFNSSFLIFLWLVNALILILAQSSKS